MLLNPVGFLDLLFFPGIITYIYMAMKQACEQSHMKTSVQFIGLAFIYVITLGFALVGNVFISFLVS